MPPKQSTLKGKGGEEIIKLDIGFKRIEDEGIMPFLQLVEHGETKFFDAKQFVGLYDHVFKMCIQRDPYNWSADMYEKYGKSIRKYLEDTVCPSLAKAESDQYETAFLKEWTKRWKNQQLIVKNLAKLFMYLDRFYTPNTDGIFSLTEQGFKLFKETVFDRFAETARNCILKAIGKERDAEEQDRQLLNDSVQVFVEIGYQYADSKLKVYKQELERFLLDHAGAFYKRKSRIWMDQDSCPVFMEKAEQCLEAERARVSAYLHPSTAEPLIKECFLHLLHHHRRELLSKPTGVFQLLEVNATDDLSRLYRLYSHSEDDLQPISEMLLDHVSKEGAALVDRSKAGGPDKKKKPKAKPAEEVKTEKKEDEKEGDGESGSHTLVKRLIDLHARYATIVQMCFDNHQIFQKSLKKAFEKFINMDNRVSKQLAKYVNDVLKKYSKVRPTDLDGTLDNIVFLYGYLTEKDVFERDYQIYLGNRLLMDLYESEHSEKGMIAKLKTEAGYQWTNKLEGMFKDVNKSRELMVKFKKHFDAERAIGLNLEVNVCTTGYWPSSKMIPCKLPKELETACDKFKRFYLNQHSGHKLEWRMDQGQAEVQVAFSKEVRRGLIVSTYQMMILLVFNSMNVATFQQILEITGIPKYEIANHLLSLVHPNVKILLKKPPSRDLGDDHVFKINPKYNNKLLKIQVPLLRAVENKRENDEEAEAIQLQRSHQMDAAVVRIMKTRKTLRHNQLVTEVVSQLQARFKPRPNDIKKRIEALIELEYLKRDDDDRALYHYLA